MHPLRQLKAREKQLLREAISTHVRLLSVAEEAEDEVEELKELERKLKPIGGPNIPLTYDLHLDEGRLTVIIRGKVPTPEDALSSFLERHDLEPENWYIKKVRTEYDGVYTICECASRRVEKKREKTESEVAKVRARNFQRKVSSIQGKTIEEQLDALNEMLTDLTGGRSS